MEGAWDGDVQLGWAVAASGGGPGSAPRSSPRGSTDTAALPQLSRSRTTGSEPPGATIAVQPAPSAQAAGAGGSAAAAAAAATAAVGRHFYGVYAQSARTWKVEVSRVNPGSSSGKYSTAGYGAFRDQEHAALANDAARTWLALRHQTADAASLGAPCDTCTARMSFCKDTLSIQVRECASARAVRGR
jgi:hypothetical protein